MEQELRNKYNDGGRRGYVEKMKFSAMFGKWILFYTLYEFLLNFILHLKIGKIIKKVMKQCYFGINFFFFVVLMVLV